MVNENFEPYQDMFNRCNQIKQIDSGYRLVFDKKSKMFCVINSAKCNQICMKFGSFSLDIEKILKKSRVENASKLFMEIDAKNDQISQNQEKSMRQNLEDRLIETTKFFERTNKILQSDLNKIIGVKDV